MADTFRGGESLVSWVERRSLRVGVRSVIMEGIRLRGYATVSWRTESLASQGQSVRMGESPLLKTSVRKVHGLNIEVLDSCRATSS
jgi:hypothetical protein